MFGYAGKILYVDLTASKTSTEDLDEETAKQYIGGIGLGMRLWMDHSTPRTDALSPENPLVLALGPVAGTVFPTGGNGHAFISKSPATGSLGEAVSHGAFGAELKRAGYDAIVISGKAEKPVYLWIDNESIQLLDAAHLWGKSPSETEEAIKDDLGDYYVRVASIGLAGEKQSKLACILNEKTRAAGRTGLGAVMGSKNLKAIAVRGTHDIVPANPEAFMALVKEYRERALGPATEKYRGLGTVESILINNTAYCMPTRNYRNAHFEDAEKVSGEVLNDKYVAKIIACSTCPMRCEHEAVVRDGPYKGTMARIEYESVWALGPYTGVNRPDAIIKAAALCTQYGMDAQSVGVTVGFAMDCHEKGILTHDDLGGVDAHFGNAEAMLQLIEEMGKREGIGDILADGVKAAAEKIGKGAPQLAQHIKGLEVTGYDLRCLKTAALAAAVSFRGADQNRSGAYAVDLKGSVNRLKAERGRGRIVKTLEDVYALVDSLIVCKNARGLFQKDTDDLAKLYSVVTGTDVTAQYMSVAAERINTLARLINLREGLTRQDDALPWKVLHEPIPDEGPVKGAVVTERELDLLLDDYYAERGWDKQGVPTPETLKRLNLDNTANAKVEA